MEVEPRDPGLMINSTGVRKVVRVGAAHPEEVGQPGVGVELAELAEALHGNEGTKNQWSRRST